jgi:hypothetical protein
MSSRFDKFAAPLGGAYYPDPRRRAGYHFMMERCRTYIAGKVAALCPDPAIVQIEVNWLRNVQFNAVAGTEDGLHCIGINVGAGYVLMSLFDNMLSDPECLSHIGDPSIETPHKNFDPEGSEINLSDPLVRTRAYEPKCPIRAQCATSLSNAAFYFLFFHELGHVFNGHIKWLEQTCGFNSLGERGASAIPGLNSLDLQTLEMDADASACGSILMWVLRAEKNLKNGGPRFPMDTGLGAPIDAIFLLIIAIHALFRIFSDEELTTEEELFKYDHPPAMFRQQYMAATFLEIIKIHNIVEESVFIEKFKNALEEVEQYFRRAISVRPYHSIDINNVSLLAGNVLSRLLKNWKIFRPQLDPL